MASLAFTDEEFDQILRKAQNYYSTLGDIYCPYFQKSVHFNAQGLEHLRRKTWNRGREQRDQFMRLKHIAVAPEILRSSQTLQGKQETSEWERRKRHGRWEKLLISVIYYEFVAVLRERRFKVIIKQLPGGDRIFWSLIPFWRQNDYGKRLLHDGDPSTD